MYANASNNVPSYTYGSSYVVWRVHPPDQCPTSQMPPLMVIIFDYFIFLLTKLLLLLIINNMHISLHLPKTVKKLGMIHGEQWSVKTQVDSMLEQTMATYDCYGKFQCVHPHLTWIAWTLGSKVWPLKHVLGHIPKYINYKQIYICVCVTVCERERE